MKIPLGIVLFSLSGLANAQGNVFEVYPWNPDANYDQQIGTTDLTSFLSAFGNSFDLSPEPCDYYGTDYETFFFDILNGSLTLDSIYFSFSATDVQSYYVPGCPEPVVDTVTIAQYATGYFDHSVPGEYYTYTGEYSDGSNFYVSFGFNSEYNTYSLTVLKPQIMNSWSSDGFFGGGAASARIWEYGLPLDVLSINESGLFQNEGPYVTGGPAPNLDDNGWTNFMSFATTWSLIPYWQPEE